MEGALMIPTPHDALEAAHHVVATALAIDHIDCKPDECEFVGVTYFADYNEFDCTADRVIDALDAAGWLRATPEPKLVETNLYPPG